MKKNLDKFLSVASMLLASVLIIFLLVVCMGTPERAQEYAGNGPLIAVFLVIAIAFFATAGWGMYLVFASNDELKEVLVYMNEDSKTKVTKRVIVKLVKKTLKDEEGIKIKGTKVLVTERGLSLFVRVKVENVDVEETFEYLKSLLANVFIEVIKVSFHEINFKVINLKTAYEAPRDDLKVDARKKLGKKEAVKKIEPKKAVSEEKVSATEPVEDESASLTKN